MHVDLVADEPSPSKPDNIVRQLRREVSRRFSGIFAEQVTEAQIPSSPSNDQVPLSSSMPIPRKTNRVVSSRTSRANGSAYGYGGIRSRLPSAATSLRRGSMASTVRNRRGTFGEGGTTDAIGTMRTEGSNFAQRLLMANEMAVTNIADLWVAAAINADNDEVFMSDEDDQDFFDDDLDVGDVPRLSRGRQQTITPSSVPSRNPLEMHRTVTAESAASFNPLEIRRTLTTDSAGPRNPLEISRTLTADSAASRNTFYPSRYDSPAGRFSSSVPQSPSPVLGHHVSNRHMTPSRARLSAMSPAVREPLVEGSSVPSPQLRHRGSRAFSMASSQLPSIYANAGVRAPPGVLVDPAMPLQVSGEGEDPFNDGLGTIPEGRQRSQPQAENEERPQSLFKQLPLMIILQYGLLALHSTTHDQIFLSYLVS